MYEALKAQLLWLLKVPPEPLDPMGDVRTLRVFRAAPGYWRYMTVGWLLTEVAILIGIVAADVPLAIVGSTSTAVGILVTLVIVGTLVLFVLQLAISYFSLRLNYEMRWYKVTDRSLRIRTGVWNVSEMTMTFDNIQNITVTQGPLERLFGISDVPGHDCRGRRSRRAEEGRARCRAEPAPGRLQGRGQPRRDPRPDAGAAAPAARHGVGRSDGRPRPHRHQRLDRRGRGASRRSHGAETSGGRAGGRAER